MGVGVDLAEAPCVTLMERGIQPMNRALTM